MKRLIRSWFTVSLALVIACGCSGGAPSSDTASSASPKSPAAPADSKIAPTGANAAVGAPGYPDWAQAVVPPYPKPSTALALNTSNYQFQTADDRGTVVAWYKSQVPGTWNTDATSGDQSIVVKGVQIDVTKNTSGDTTANKTMIMISKR